MICKAQKLIGYSYLFEFSRKIETFSISYKKYGATAFNVKENPNEKNVYDVIETKLTNNSRVFLLISVFVRDQSFLCKMFFFHKKFHLC